MCSDVRVSPVQVDRNISVLEADFFNELRKFNCGVQLRASVNSSSSIDKMKALARLVAAQVGQITVAGHAQNFRSPLSESPRQPGANARTEVSPNRVLVNDDNGKMEAAAWPARSRLGNENPKITEV